MKFKDVKRGEIFFHNGLNMRVYERDNVNAVSLEEGDHMTFYNESVRRPTEYELIELIKTKLPKSLIFSSINSGEIFSMHSTVSGVDNTYTCIKTGKMSHRHQEGNAVVIDTLNLCNYYREGMSIKVQDYEIVKRVNTSFEESES